MLAIVLSGCGGGPGIPLPPDTSNYGSFTVDKSTVNFNATQFSQAFTTQIVNVHVTDMTTVASVRAAYVSATAPTNWISVTTSGAAGNYQVEVYAFPTGLAAGTYSAVVNINTIATDGRVLKSRDVTVTLTFTTLTIFPDSQDVVAAVTLGHSAVTRNATIHVTAPTGQQWTANSSVPWIHLPTTPFTGTSDVPIQLDATGLPLGNYSGLIRFTSSTDPLNSLGKMIYLNVTMPTLTVTPASIVLGGVDGTRDPINSFTASLATGTNSYPFTVTLTTANGVSWLASNVTSGQVGQSPTTLSLTGNRSAVPPGSYAGALRFDATVQGQLLTITRAVTFNLEADGIIASSLGVGLSKFPSRSVLTRRIRISSTQDRPGVSWVASSNQPWLSVTSNGTTGDDLVITANSTGMTAEQIHHATVTVSSAQTSMQNQQVIRVALWVGSTDPIPVSNPLPGIYGFIAANPTEPLAYISKVTDAIDVYNVYSGSLVNTIPLVGSGIGEMALSDDGATLFVADLTNHRIVAFDALTGQQVGIYNNGSQTAHYARPDGHPVLIAGNGEVIDLSNGTSFQRVLTELNYYSNTRYNRNSTSRFLFGQNRGLSPSTLVKYRMSYSSLVAGRFTADVVALTYAGENGQDLCVSADDRRVYSSNGAPYEFVVLDAATLGTLPPLPGQAYPTEIDCSWNGWVAGGVIAQGQDPTNIWIYDSAGVSVAKLKLGQSSTSQVSFSADATRLVAITNALNGLAIDFASTPPF